MLGLGISLTRNLPKVTPLLQILSIKYGDVFAGEVFYVEPPAQEDRNSYLVVEGFIGNIYFEKSLTADFDGYYNYDEELRFTPQVPANLFSQTKAFKYIKDGRVYEDSGDILSTTEFENGFTCLSLSQVPEEYELDIVSNWYQRIYLENQDKFKPGLYIIPIVTRYFTSEPELVSDYPLLGRPNMYAGNTPLQSINHVLDTRTGEIYLNVDTTDLNLPPIVVRAYATQFESALQIPTSIIAAGISEQNQLELPLFNYGDDTFSPIDVLNLYGGISETAYINIYSQRFRDRGNFKEIPTSVAIENDDLLNIRGNLEFSKVTISETINKIVLRFIVITNSSVPPPWSTNEQIYLSATVIPYGVSMPQTPAENIAVRNVTETVSNIELNPYLYNSLTNTPTLIDIEGGYKYIEYIATIDITQMGHPLGGTIESRSYSGELAPGGSRYRSCLFGVQAIKIYTDNKFPVEIPQPQSCNLITVLTLTDNALNAANAVAEAKFVHIKRVINDHSDTNYGTAAFRGSIQPSFNLGDNTTNYLIRVRSSEFPAQVTQTRVIDYLSPTSEYVGVFDINGDMDIILSGLYKFKLSGFITFDAPGTITFYMVKNGVALTQLDVTNSEEGQTGFSLESSSVALTSGDIVEIKYTSTVSFSTTSSLPLVILVDNALLPSPPPQPSGTKPEYNYF